MQLQRGQQARLQPGIGGMPPGADQPVKELRLEVVHALVNSDATLAVVARIGSFLCASRVGMRSGVRGTRDHCFDIIIRLILDELMPTVSRGAIQHAPAGHLTAPLRTAMGKHWGDIQAINSRGRCRNLCVEIWIRALHDRHAADLCGVLPARLKGLCGRVRDALHKLARGRIQLRRGQVLGTQPRRAKRIGSLRDRIYMKREVHGLRIG